MQTETVNPEATSSTTLNIASPHTMELLEQFDSVPLSRLSVTYRRTTLFSVGGWTVAWILASDREEGTTHDASLEVALRRALAALEIARGTRDGEEASRT